MQSFEDINQKMGIIVAAGHEVASTQIEPLELGEPTTELALDMRKRTLQNIGTALAMAMAVESLDMSRQLLRKLVGRHSEAGSRSTGIVEQCAHLGITGIDTQPH